MDMWPMRQTLLPPCSSSTRSLLRHLLTPWKGAFILCMPRLQLSVCVCVFACPSYMHTHSQQSPRSHPNARPDHVQRLSSNPSRVRVCMLITVSVCVCWVGGGCGRCRKDTLTNPSLHILSRLARGDLGCLATAAFHTKNCEAVCSCVCVIY